MGRDTIDAVRVLVVFVVRKFVSDVGEDEGAAGDADSQAEDIDQGIRLVLDEVPAGGFYEIPEHPGLLAFKALR